jgi:hypothetical protein
VALGGEMPRHRKAHHAQTQKRHLGHRLTLQFRRREHRAHPIRL